MKTPEPESRLGVFKSYDDIPGRWRLDGRAGTYDGRDVWAEYEAAEGLNPENPNRKAAKNKWDRIAADRGEHPALATPETVEIFAGELIELSVPTIRGQFPVIHRFYEWLRWDDNHPHTYNPVLLAACNYPNTADVWATYKNTDRYEEI